MFDAIDYLIDMISSLFNFIWSMISGFFQLFEILPQVLSFITGSVGYLPSLFTAFFATAVTISVIFLTLGRGKE